MLEVLIGKAAKCGAKQALFILADVFAPGTGQMLRTVDKVFKVGCVLQSGMPEFDEALDNAGGFVDNLIYL